MKSSNTNIQEAELKIFYDYLSDKATTQTAVCKATGLHQKNTCRYKSLLQKQNKLWVVKLGICPITKRSNVQFITTNSEYRKIGQFKLFEND